MSRSTRRQAGRPHLHACAERSCRQVYECTCTTPVRNGRCHTCRGLIRPIWVAARDPRDCCVGNCRQATTEELARYRLAGPGPWFICKTCARVSGWPRGFNHVGATHPTGMEENSE